MADLKTKPTAKSVAQFLAGVEDETTRRDCREILKIMHAATGARPKLWGSSMVGFGSYHYKYESGREGDWFITGFSPRRKDITLYIMSGLHEHGALLRRLGRHKVGKSCLYIRSLDDVDRSVLTDLIRQSVRRMGKASGKVSGD